MGSSRKSEEGGARSGGRLFSHQSKSMNERVAEALHRKVMDEIHDPYEVMGKPTRRLDALASYTKKVLDHLVMLEEEVQDLHRRNHQLSRRLRALQNRVDTARRKG